MTSMRPLNSREMVERAQGGMVGIPRSAAYLSGIGTLWQFFMKVLTHGDPGGAFTVTPNCNDPGRMWTGSSSFQDCLTERSLNHWGLRESLELSPSAAKRSTVARLRVAARRGR